MLPPLLLYHLLRRRVLPSEVSAPRPGLSRDLTAADPPRVCVCACAIYICSRGDDDETLLGGGAGGAARMALPLLRRASNRCSHSSNR
ncbi:unnamed protein product [Musa textilis]